MSSSPDCIVIGGGVVGLTIARQLALDGARVLVIERGECGREASWAGAGILSPVNPHRNDKLSRFQDRSIALYPVLCSALHEETGVDPEYDPCGELQIVFTKDTLGIARSDERAACGRTMPDGAPAYQLHDSKKAREIEPLISKDALGALECRATAVVRNPRLLQALIASCVRNGVAIREHAAVERFVRSGDRVTGVLLDGESISSFKVVLCAGAWSSRMDPLVHELMPVHPVRGQIVLLKLDERPFRRVISQGRFYLVPRRDGHVLLGATEEPEAGFEKRNTPQGVSQLMDKAVSMVPHLGNAPVASMWSGLRPGTADDRPYIGPVPGLEGLIAATGHFRNGLTLAPATAEAVSALVFGREVGVDLAPFRAGRHLEGSSRF